jgi:8-oxo-dGTP pyrophosphatase MutT (NUDIX family)
MWLMTTFGFFSVVQKKGTKQLTVRARVQNDLDRLRRQYLPTLSLTQETLGSDYRYRATVSHADLGAAMARIVGDIHYHNFKSEIDHVQGHARESVYAKVWSVLSVGLPPLDESDRAARAGGVSEAPGRRRTIPKADKYGGIVFDDAGRVLLREPKNHFDGYVWTFAKGDPSGTETPEETALREVREETGVAASVEGVIPKVFTGGTGTVVYFVMAKIEQHALAETGRGETQAVRWVPVNEAVRLLGATTKAVGRRRDLAALAAACKVRRTR